MSFEDLLEVLGPEIEDPEEGFVDSKSSILELTIAGRDLTIHQSPTILSSNRGGGTTGAVVWKITPLFASWLASPTNTLFKYNILDGDATILELGCGISGIIGLAVAHLVSAYVLTDQNYVMKLLNENLETNSKSYPFSSSKGRNSKTKFKSPDGSGKNNKQTSCTVTARVLDWEEDLVSASLIDGEAESSFDVVIACDCIYNDALIEPLVRTCVDACNLRSSHKEAKPTVVVVAQQLRSAEVFESWLKSFHKEFRVWRLPDEILIEGLKSNSGFVIHLGVLR